MGVLVARYQRLLLNNAVYIVFTQVDSQGGYNNLFGEDIHFHDHVLYEFAHWVSNSSLASEK